MYLNPLYKLLIYCFVLLLLGCNQKDDNVIDLSDIIPSSENEYSDADSSLNNNLYLGDLAFFNQGALHFDDVQVKQERLFPDRFGPDTSLTYLLIQNEDSVRYHKWVFADSAKVINAFYNWIDCFGKNCKSRYMGEESNFQTEASIILVTDTTLIFVEGKNLSFKDWYAFHDKIGYEKNWNYLLEQPYRGRAKWYVLKNEEKTKYVKK